MANWIKKLFFKKVHIHSYIYVEIYDRTGKVN